MNRITSISSLTILMVLLLPMIAKLMKRYSRWLMTGKVCILVMYLLVNLYVTVLSRTPAADYSTRLSLFWSYISLFKGETHLGIQIILNILLYVPLGYLLRFTFQCLKAWQVIAIGCLLSALTETTQLIFKLGMFEWDDMINNTLGTVIGVCCYWGMKKVIGYPLE